MEIRDLMIGDWVLYKDEPITVFEIDEYYDRINTEPDGYNAIRCIEGSDIKSIPLTPEILEQNGFRKESYIEVVGGLDTYYLGEEIGSFRIHRLQKGYYQFGLAKINFVHQLQHALRLCGIEKEIEI